MRPQRTPILTALVVLTLGLALTALATAAAPQTKYRGVMLHSLWPDSTNGDMDHELDMASAAGANVVRIDVAWSTLETGGKGAMSQWYVDKLDRFVNGAQSRGMKVLANLWSTPCWASSAPENLRQGCEGSWWDRGVTVYPPKDAGDFGDIGKWLTARYGSKLAAVEVWNEPNHPSSAFWKAPDKARAYADLVKGSYAKIKAGDASVPVIVGSLAGTDRPFLKALYAAGIKGSSDGIAVHPYNDSRGFGGLTALHADMLAAGDRDPVWVTEFGWPTGSDRQWHVSEAEQATDLRNGFGDLARIPWVALATVYNLRDKGTNDSSMEDNFGLVRRDYSPKPAYSALAGALSGQTPPDPIKGRPGSGDAADQSVVQAGLGSGNGSGSVDANQPKSGSSGNVKLRVALSAPGKKVLAASGQVVGRPKGVVTLTVLRAQPDGRFVPFTSRTAVVRGGRFKTIMSSYKKGQYQIRAALRGSKAVGQRQARLNGQGATGPARSGLPEGVVRDGRQGVGAAGGPAQAPTAVTVETASGFGSTVSPGPLRTGGLLRVGSHGRLVTLVKRRLRDAGYAVPAGTSYEAATEAAVRRFQTDRGLLVDGIVGRQTMASLLQ